MKSKKIISILLTIAMMLTFVPLNVMASNGTNIITNWDFDDGKTWEQLTAMTNDSIVADADKRVWADWSGTSAASIENGKLSLGGNSRGMVRLAFPDEIPNGRKVKISWEVKPSEAGFFVQGVGNAFFPQFSITNSGSILVTSTKNHGTGAFVDYSKTYNCELVYDFSDGSYAFKVSNAGNVVQQYTLEQARAAGKTGNTNMGENATLCSIQIQSNADTANGTKSYFDNIKVEYYIPELTISEENVTIYEGTVSQSDLTAVSPDADKIEIDMGAEPDMTACEGKITLKAGSTPVAFTGSADGNKYVMMLEDGALSESTDYTITFATGVKTVDGATLSSDVNIAFSTTSKSEAIDKATIILDWNFDGKTLADLISSDTTRHRIISSEANDTTHEVLNGEFVAKTSNGTANTRVRLAAASAITTTDLGRIKVSADVKTNGQVAVLGLVGNDFLPNLQLSTSAQLIQGGSLIGQGSSVRTDDWYSIYVIYDFDNNEIIYGYGKKGEGATESKVSGKLSREKYTKIDGIILNAWKSNNSVTTDVQWDNLKLEYDALTPFVGEDDITIFCAETAESNKSDISPAASKIVIDFNSTIMPSSVEGAIILQNITDSTIVNFTGNLSKTKYTMQLTDILQANKEYKLTLSKAICNIKGVSLDDDITYTFKTGVGRFDLELSAIKQNGEIVNDFDSLTQGDGTVEIKVENTTGVAKNVIMICNGYNGNELLKCGVYDVEIPADAVNIIIL